jgi:hypothetical protein
MKATPVDTPNYTQTLARELVRETRCLSARKWLLSILQNSRFFRHPYLSFHDFAQLEQSLYDLQALRSRLMEVQ